MKHSKLITSTLISACILASNSAFALSLIDSGTNSPVSIVNNAIFWLLRIVGALAVLFLLYGGILMVTSLGNEKQVETAKKTLTYAVLGIIVVVLAYLIVSIVIKATGEAFTIT